MAALAALRASTPRKLRVGVFADAQLQPRWLVAAFAAAARDGVADLVCYVKEEAAAPARRRSLYERFDRWAFSAADPDAPADLADAAPCRAWRDAGELDVAFAVGEVDERSLEGRARLGTWRYAVDGRREVAAGEMLTPVRLEVSLPGHGPRRVAYASWSRTYPLSMARNRAGLLAKASALAARALREASLGGRAWLESCPPAPQHEQGAVGALGVARIGARIAARAVTKALYVDQWSLAFAFGREPNAALEGFTRILPPPDRDWADPFALERDGRWYVFFEELPYAAGKAHISMIELDAAGRWSAPVRVLERDYHLSYPFLLEHEGELYMIPETGQNRTVELYRCVDFPRRWRLERVLIDGVRCVDATLHRGTRRWWMFANVAPGESRVFDDELHIFHAPGLFAEWQPHAANPVKSDVRCARPAGAVYARDGALYRPSQICAPRYGAGLCLNRIVRLTAEEFSERPVERLLPPAGSGLLGMHTVNRAGALVVVDAFSRRRRFA